MKIAQSAKQSGTWCLSECAGSQIAPRVIAIAPLPFVIGRLPDSNLCLPVPAISKCHAEIVFEGGRPCVRDLGSTNGTFVNDRQVAGREPLTDGDLLRFAAEVYRVQRQQPAAHLRTVAQGSFAIVESMCQLDRLMSERAVTPHFQPIVRLADRHVIGFEALARSPITGLKTPDAMFLAAERLGQEVSLSILLRREGVLAGKGLPPGAVLYLNTHAKELGTPELISSLEEIRLLAPSQPMTIEVHEAAATDERALLELRTTARRLNMQMAYDDFGAGQARLDELARVAPDVVKFDMRLIRELHSATPERRLVTSRLVELVRDLDIVPLAEGVECEEEAAACLEVGFELAQGYHFGRPAPLGS